MRKTPAFILIAALASVLTAACAPTVDLTTGLQIEAVSTGWFGGGGGGKNKVVPGVSLTLKNVSAQELAGLQVNAVFRRVNDGHDWGSGFRSRVGSTGLAPGKTTPPLTLQSEVGYTSTDSDRDMLGHSQFIDASVDVFVRYGSTPWVRLGRYPIDRRLIDR